MAAGAKHRHVAAAEGRLDDAHLRDLILDRIPAIVWTTDADLRLTFGSGDLAELGLTSSEGSRIGTTLFDYFCTCDRAHPWIAPHLRALEGTPVAFETRWHDRWFQSRIEPLRARTGQIIGCIGIAFDVTAQARTAQSLARTDARLRRLFESNVIGLVFWQSTGRIVAANDAFLKLLGYTREELLSQVVSWRALTPPEYADLDRKAITELRTQGTCTPFEKEYFAKDGTRVPVLIGGATFGRSGRESDEGVAFVLDLREQVRLRRARDRLLAKEQLARVEAEIANARLLLLIEGGARLSRCLMLEETLETLAEVVVPELADWSYIAHRGWDGGPTLVASMHFDPERRKLLRQLHSCRPDPAAPEGAPRVFRTGEVALYEDITAEQLSPSPLGWPVVGTRDPEHLRLVRELGMRSLLCVPIAGRSGIDAVMMLVSASDPHRFRPADVVLARELASRAAISLENSRLLAEAVESVRARDEFMAIAAHELRTPLTPLLLELQMLSRTIEGGRFSCESAPRAIKASEAHVRRLSTLVDRLLDVTLVTANQMMIGVEDLDLARLLREVVLALSPDLRRAGCVVELTMPERMAGKWDRVRIEQVLRNLLSNAMKFGAGKPIEVRGEMTATDIRITVRDHGIGISPEDQSRIFGRFERAVSTRHFGGLGLGLYISTQILRAHRGSLRVESELGKGATFIIELPRYPAGAP